MGQLFSSIPNTINGMSQDIHETLNELTSTIHALQIDASGTINQLSEQITESIQIITREAEQTTVLLRNGFFAMMTAMSLSVLLYLSDFSPFLRAIIWTLYAALCFHMIMTYLRHSRRRISHSPNVITYKNDHLQRKILQSKNAKEIDLLGEQLSDDDMKIVVNQAINKQQCICLKLIHNQLTSNAISILSQGLINNTQLERLSLWKNPIGDSGVEFLANALSTNRCVLKKLDLSENEITDRGAEYLGQMLRTNTRLTHLTLSQNRITDDGLRYLIDALLNRNQTLQVLSLTQNKLLTDECIDNLIELFESNGSLKKLWINDCDLSKRGRERLRRAKPIDLELFT